jgi:two-component system sensor histidine kinase QseC
LRNRFFFIILSSLTIAAVGISLVHAVFFKAQRLKLIDRQISESSAELLRSDAFLRAVRGPAAAVEDAISRVLQGSRIGKVFVLRDRDSKILYESFNVGLVKTDLPIKPEWVAVQTKDEYIRLRNVPLPGDDAITLQVGLVLDRNFLNWEIIDRRLVNYVTAIVAALFLASVLLTLILLAPLRLLIAHLSEASASLGHMRLVRPLPKRLTRFTRGFWAQSDEFSGLLSTMQKLIDRINLNYKLTRSWTLQMAHELKTPLAIVRAETESQAKAGAVPAALASAIITENERMSGTISQFLEWAELENSQSQKDLHAVRMKAAVEEAARRLEKIAPGRLELRLNADFSILANPSHLEQLISNLITNAIKFSPAGSPIELKLEGRRFTVSDRGEGLPADVKMRLGEPFNVGRHESKDRSGSGLGLAWVMTVANLYNWNFEILSGAGGTQAIVTFPAEEDFDQA